MNHLRLAAKLIANGCRYRALKLTGGTPKLEAISLEVTHRCFCSCRMCNIWRMQDTDDLDLATWTDLLGSPELRGIRELDITGGEPFLRQDLPELLDWICRAHGDRFPRLQTVAITTNGIITDRILRCIKQNIEALGERGIDLVLACGMDAVGELHDEIRGFKGAWEKLNETLDGLLRVREDHPNLILGIKTTIIPLNVNELVRIADFARSHELFTIISPRIITANRFGNTALADDLEFNEAARQALCAFYRGPDFVWAGHRAAMLNYLETGRMKKACSAGFNTVFVRHNGEVFPCPIIQTALGNIKHDKLAVLMAGQTARQFRRMVGHHKECRTCTEPGLERLAWPYEGFTCLRWMTKLGSEEFNALAKHMGLFKYL